jgi:hypothetical protein
MSHLHWHGGLHEVYYVRHVGMPNGRVPPLALGMSTRRTGGGK